jgi:hypothetical protein
LIDLQNVDNDSPVAELAEIIGDSELELSVIITECIRVWHPPNVACVPRN